MNYILGLEPRVVSLAVRPLDAYTGKTPSGAYVFLDGVAPIVKPGGYFVYANLPDASHIVTAGGNMLFERTATLSGSRLITDLLLIPDGSRYKLDPGAAYVEYGTGQPSARFFAAPLFQDIRLTAAYEPEGLFIETNCVDYDLEGRLLAVCSDKIITDIFRIGQCAGGGKYALRKAVSNKYGAEQVLLPLSLGKTDERGGLLVPMWKTTGSTEAVLYTAGGEEYKKLEIKHFSKR